MNSVLGINLEENIYDDDPLNLQFHEFGF